MKRKSGTLARLIAQEAIAYARTGMLVSAKARIPRPAAVATGGEGPKLGVLFVHGVGADSSQFSALHDALRASHLRFEAFEYRSTSSIDSVLASLRAHIERAATESGRLMVIGHSLGGLLLRCVLQEELPPAGVVAFASICAPLHGTHVSRFAPTSDLRGFTPGSPRVAQLHRTRDRLDRLRPMTLTVGALRDQFVWPFSSAFLEGTEQLELTDAGHVSSLFDERVHRAVRRLLIRARAASKPSA